MHGRCRPRRSRRSGPPWTLHGFAPSSRNTCHLLASGYDITTERGYGNTFAEFERIVGLDRLKVFHMNDSKNPCRSRVDRHEHIGRGCLGPGPFKRIVHDPRFRDLAMLLETPKTEGRSAGQIVRDPLDDMNLRTLRRLITATPKR